MDFESEVKHRLMRCGRTKIILLGIGNEFRRDDAIGLTVIDKLAAFVHDPLVILIKCHDAPERFTGHVKRLEPTCIIIIDAADFGGFPGQTHIFELEELENLALTTHRPSLAVLGEYLRAETAADVFVIGIQPANQEYGEGMSRTANRASVQVVDALRTALNQCGTKRD